MERAKISPKDHIKLLFITKWFLDFFLTRRKNLGGTTTTKVKWNLSFIAEVTERDWIVWVLKRMRNAVEEKPKLWTELQAGIECLTQLFILIDLLSASDISDDPALAESASLLQHQLIYNGEVLDITLDSLRSYKEGTQSLAFLGGAVHMGYVLLRVLERWSKSQGSGEGGYVRRRKVKRKKRKGESFYFYYYHYLLRGACY
jgi:replication fork protection complex subunit Tof1/Swi1